MVVRNSLRACFAALLVTFGVATAAIAEQGVQGSAPSETHPLAKLLAFARSQHEFVKKNVRDYTCQIVKREQIDGVMQEYHYMWAKVRTGTAEDQPDRPFAVHMTYLKLQVNVDLPESEFRVLYAPGSVSNDRSTAN